MYKTNIAKTIIRWMSIVLVVFILVVGSGCGQQNTPSPIGVASKRYYMNIPLGKSPNSFYIIKKVYMGWDVTSFKLVLQMQYGSFDKSKLHIVLKRGETVIQELIGTLKSIGTIEEAPYLTYSSDEISGNWVDLHIYSDGLITYDPPRQNLALVSAEVHYDHTHVMEVPTGSNAEIEYAYQNNQPIVQALKLNATEETISLSQGFNPVQHFYFTGELNQAYLLYISPVDYDSTNETGPVAGISNVGYVSVPQGIRPTTEPTDSSVPIIPPLHFTKLKAPEPGDTGILYLIPPSKTLYLTLRQGIGSAALISVNPIRINYEVNFEVEDGLANLLAPPIPYNEIIMYEYGSTNNIPRPTFTLWPYAYSDAGFISVESNYFYRLREMVVFFTADLLNSSDGQFFISRANLYRSFNSDIDSDVKVYSSAGSADCPSACARQDYIEMHANWLANPLRGGATLNHEWGHYKYDLPDEYVSKGICLDPNTLMCDPEYSSSGETMREYCTVVNHPDIAGEKSNWTIIQEKTGVFGSGTKSSAFHDVLFALRKLISFSIHD